MGSACIGIALKYFTLGALLAFTLGAVLRPPSVKWNDGKISRPRYVLKTVIYQFPVEIPDDVEQVATLEGNIGEAHLNDFEMKDSAILKRLFGIKNESPKISHVTDITDFPEIVRVRNAGKFGMAFPLRKRRALSNSNTGDSSSEEDPADNTRNYVFTTTMRLGFVENDLFSKIALIIILINCS